MFGFTTRIAVKALERSSDAVFDVLNTHGVFGEFDEGRERIERLAFKRSVIDHATGENNHNYLEFLYPSGIRLVIHTAIFAGTAMFREVNVYARPDIETRINPERLQKDIRDAQSELKAW